jgi:hypothetical protein
MLLQERHQQCSSRKMVLNANEIVVEILKDG